ncbi:MAG: hypothetical protein A2977_00195 [Alphaproteobacteria bacterium RIFCSPLOWO2_01_FULL_45_8]|nr:MAG: hypothetical protein A3K20_01315 [Alphaproteobacteria bacterium GWA1_45_9]OFW96168.1 MAG: hypothetical protein A2977_00195 [Alphaproteobacteria bacterium RIFCSPLOWO2_01_FULL_45_8]HCI48336.1 hypothetical protein [Holosporales bacterium]
MTEETLLKDLTQHSHVQVPFPIPCTQIKEAVQSFLRFVELPDEIKNHIDTKIATRHRRGDIGLKQRSPEDGPYRDSKEFFHFHPLVFQQYAAFINAHPEVQDFLMKAQPLWEATYKVVHQIISSLEEQFPGITAKVFDTDEPHVMIRFLRYHWASSGKYLAKPHFDSGSFTLAIAESCPGLRMGRGPDDLELIHHQEGHALFFFSSNFKKILNTDMFSAGWHDVIQLDDTQIGKPFARWAVVAFIDGIDVEALSRSETHKWCLADLA